MKSSLAAVSPLNIFKQDTILMSIKVYADGSGKTDKNPTGIVTLAAIAAPESAWISLESVWQNILADRGNPGYMHIAEMVQGVGPFNGWSGNDKEFLCQGLIGALKQFMYKKFNVRAVVVSVDTEDYLKQTKLKESIAEVCTYLTFRTICKEYAKSGLAIDSFELYFDRNEPFMDTLYGLWQKDEKQPDHRWLQYVGNMLPVNMKKTPAIQATDMLGWSQNRIKTTSGEGWSGHIAKTIITELPLAVGHLDKEELQ